MGSFSDTIDAANQTRQLRINPKDYPSVVCPDCGSKIFMPAAMFKKIPGVLVGSGAEEQIFPVQVYICAKCHTLMPDMGFEELENEPEEKQLTKSNIII
jgi:hypothetical protein